VGWRNSARRKVSFFSLVMRIGYPENGKSSRMERLVAQAAFRSPLSNGMKPHFTASRITISTMLPSAA
jgi:ribosome biogenesis GTPase A